jgi:hypothetical protein
MTFTGIVGSKNDYLIHHFINGLKKHGYTQFKLQDYRNITCPNTKSDVCIGWSVRQLNAFQGLGENVIVLENPYFGYLNKKPADWTSVGWNGLGGRANFCNKKSPPTRWNDHFSYFEKEKLKDWSGGDFILLLTQVYGDQSLILKEQECNEKIDYNKIIAQIRKNTKLPIYVKHHPNEENPNIWNIPNDISIINKNISVYDAVQNAKICVTINSNSAVEAVLGGTPTITLDRGSMAWDVTEHNFDKIENPPLPDRTQWLYDTSYCQWKIEEFENGDVWDHLRKIYN